MRHFIEPNSFSLDEQLALLDLADRMEADPAPYAHLCDGRILATLFYEPSTRTRLSFESAMPLGLFGGYRDAADLSIKCLADLIDRIAGGDLSCAKQDDLGRHVLHIRNDMGGQDDQSILRKTRDHIPESDPFLWIKTCGRFV